MPEQTTIDVEWRPEASEARAAMDLADSRRMPLKVAVGLGLVCAAMAFVGPASWYPPARSVLWAAIALLFGLAAGFGMYHFIRSTRILRASGLLSPRRWILTEDGVRVVRDGIEVRFAWDSVCRILLSERVVFLELSGAPDRSEFIARRSFTSSELDAMLSWSGAVKPTQRAIRIRQEGHHLSIHIYCWLRRKRLGYEGRVSRLLPNVSSGPILLLVHYGSLHKADFNMDNVRPLSNGYL